MKMELKSSGTGNNNLHSYKYLTIFQVLMVSWKGKKQTDEMGKFALELGFFLSLQVMCVGEKTRHILMITKVSPSLLSF